MQNLLIFLKPCKSSKNILRFNLGGFVQQRFDPKLFSPGTAEGGSRGRPAVQRLEHCKTVSAVKKTDRRGRKIKPLARMSPSCFLFSSLFVCFGVGSRRRMPYTQSGCCCCSLVLHCTHTRNVFLLAWSLSFLFFFSFVKSEDCKINSGLDLKSVIYSAAYLMEKSPLYFR